MANYNKEKHMLLELQNLTKSDLKALATKVNRSVNNLVNVAIEDYKKKIERDN